MIVAAQRESRGKALLDQLGDDVRGVAGQVQDELIEKPLGLEVRCDSWDGGQPLVGVAGLVCAELGRLAKALLAQ